MKKQSWSSYITPHLNKYRRETQKILSAHRMEVKNKKLKSVEEQNTLWRKKYKRAFDAVDKRHDREYTNLWNAFHKKMRK